MNRPNDKQQYLKTECQCLTVTSQCKSKVQSQIPCPVHTDAGTDTIWTPRAGARSITIFPFGRVESGSTAESRVQTTAWDYHSGFWTHCLDSGNRSVCFPDLLLVFVFFFLFFFFFSSCGYTVGIPSTVIRSRTQYNERIVMILSPLLEVMPYL